MWQAFRPAGRGFGAGGPPAGAAFPACGPYSYGSLPLPGAVGFGLSRQGAWAYWRNVKTPLADGVLRGGVFSR